MVDRRVATTVSARTVQPEYLLPTVQPLTKVRQIRAVLDPEREPSQRLTHVPPEDRYQFGA
jgi:hypothetical protein